MPIFVNQEFCKVPLDRIDQCATLFFLQELVQRMRIVTIHVDLRIQIRFELILIFDKILDVELTAGFLMLKLLL